MKSEDILILAGVLVGGVLLFKPVQAVGQGFGTAVQGTGQGISTATQGIGQGISQISTSTSSGYKDIIETGSSFVDQFKVGFGQNVALAKVQEEARLKEAKYKSEQEAERSKNWQDLLTNISDKVTSGFNNTNYKKDSKSKSSSSVTIPKYNSNTNLSKDFTYKDFSESKQTLTSQIATDIIFNQSKNKSSNKSSNTTKVDLSKLTKKYTTQPINTVVKKPVFNEKTQSWDNLPVSNWKAS